MTNIAKEQLFDILQSINGSGNFIASGVQKFTLPGLYVTDFGEVGMPLNPTQAQALIEVAQQAPFGKGSQTVTDTDVRSAWEIDASQITFQNKEWDKILKKIVKKVKTGLGLETKKINAELYKLLIYEEGDFFLPHKDSEKAAGMFGTLVVGLPSKHSGGSLFVRFDGREEVVNFAEAASNYKIPYTAFYADCEHEIKPIRSGYRLCLVYNLIQTGKETVASPRFAKQADTLAELLESWSIQEEFPKAILLDHEYTPSNFSLTSLKQHDLPRAEALLAAAEKAGYFAKLGLVTHYQEGELEDVGYGGYNRRRRRGYYEEDENLAEEGSMGEIYEETTTVSFVEEESNLTVPDFGEFNISNTEIIGKKTIGEGKPTEKAAEGYTGNAGMTMEYWYHYGAVVVWPKAKHFDFLLARPFSIRLKWLTYYLERLDDETLNARQYVEELIKNLEVENTRPHYYYKEEVDYDAIATALVKLDNTSFFEEYGLPKLIDIFTNISLSNWVELLKKYTPNLFHSAFRKIGISGDSDLVNHLLTILSELTFAKTNRFDGLLGTQIEILPKYLNELKLHQDEEDYRYGYRSNNSEILQRRSKSIIQSVLRLGQKRAKDTDWTKAILFPILRKLPRPYVNQVLAAVTLDKASIKGVLLDSIRTSVKEDLQKRVENKPTPPSDWSRIVPETSRSHNNSIWKELKSFIESPTQQVFNYTKNESYRNQMQRVIESVTIDLKMTTIRTGRPYTLRITKTQAAYERKLKAWKEDVALLKKVTST